MSATQWFLHPVSGQRFDLDATNVEGIKNAKIHGAIECEPPEPEKPDADGGQAEPEKTTQTPKGKATNPGTA